MNRSKSAWSYFTLSIVAILLTISSASAQEPEYERLMIPIFYNDPVSFGGGVFETRLTILNAAPVIVLLGPYDAGCGFGLCNRVETHPGRTFSPSLLEEGAGLYFYVERQYVDAVALDLRVYEVSRNEAWGAKIPIVRERDLRTDRVNLIGIPISETLRQTVRIYDFDNRLNSRVRVRMFGTHVHFEDTFEQPPDPLLYEGEFTFDRNDERFKAGYIQLGDLRRLAGPSAHLYETVRLEIDSRTEGLRLWAFVSINDSLSQNVSTIWP